jgi:uncharacterized repeat protein (TIGR03803 family)
LAFPHAATAAWQKSTLFFFNGTNGSGPEGGLVEDAKGNLYGTTGQGGSAGKGNVYKLTPPAKGKTAWKQTVLHNFTGADGASPRGTLTIDSAGNLFGATDAGGAYGNGTVFRLSPPAAGKTAWTETVLKSFNGASGITPMGDLVRDVAGDLYGATQGGGLANCTVTNGPTGCGTIFELSVPAKGKTVWKYTRLYAFDKTNGVNPSGGLVFDTDANLYGMAGGGVYSDGVVFKLAPPKAGKTAWTPSVIFTFDGTNGKYSDAGLATDKKGNLYGTNPYGGASDGGTVFELVKPVGSATYWTQKTLISFTGANGDSPTGRVVLDAAGNVFGTTEFGGGMSNNFSGNVFKLAPPKTAKAAWVETVLYTFAGKGTDGMFPSDILLTGTGDTLIGTTFDGGKSAHGTIYQLTAP